MPHQNRDSDGKKYLDNMLGNKLSVPEEDPLKRISAVTLATEVENGFPSDIKRGLSDPMTLTPEQHIRTPAEYKYTKSKLPQAPMTDVRPMMPKKKFKDEMMDMPRDLSNRELKRAMQR